MNPAALANFVFDTGVWFAYYKSTYKNVSGTHRQTMEIEIRSMTEQDLSYVYETGIEVSEFRTSEIEGDESPFWPKERLRDWISESDDVLLTAEKELREDHEIERIGYFLSHLHGTTGIVYIENLYVDEKYRRRGVGKSLMQEGISRLNKKGGRYFAALVKEDNERMHALLEELEFNYGDEFVWRDKIME